MERVKYDKVEVYHGNSKKKYPVYEVYLDDMIITKVSSDPEAKELVLTYLPMLSEELPVFIKDWITPRILNKNQKSLSQEKLEELDQKLLTL